MIAALGKTAEEKFGIKADHDDLKKLHFYLKDTYGGQDLRVLEKVFSSGEAAGILTVNETYFFREPAHFAFLLDLLPSYEKTGIHICCAAVAAGCEAYSIAMLIESYNKNASFPLAYHIDAFDLNPAVIETARKGVYGERALREDGSCFRYMADPCLEKIEGGYRVHSSLKKNINFFVHNLMDPLPSKEYDLVFFRNAFIYFLPWYRQRILSNLSAVLKNNGLIFLGVSETAGMQHADFTEKIRGDVFYFQKTVSQSAGFPADAAGTADYAAETPQPDTINQPVKQQKCELRFDLSAISDCISNEEKAEEIARRIQQTWNDTSFLDDVDGNELVVSVLHLLKQGDFSGAGNLLDYMETQDDSAITPFLRGEYFFLQNLFTEAELYYRISFIKNSAFWPAGYRLCSLSSADEVKKLRAEKTLEGLNRGRDFQYEVFIGGFSPDYYSGTLLKQKVSV